ncbi:MAG: hypothetical protein J6B24_08895 [Clostridia bacterium]|nr:hypothetical protein [Clostridia bacterium]
MDENRSVKPSVKVKKSHIVMLILACVCLLIALKGAKDLLAFLLAETPTYPSDVGPGGLFAVLLGEWLKGFSLVVLLLGCLPYLCGGLTLSVILCSRRRDKPAWLWGVSLGMAILLGLIAVGLIAVWILGK